MDRLIYVIPIYGFPLQIKFNKKHGTGYAQTIGYVVDNRFDHHSFNVPINYNVILRILIIMTKVLVNIVIHSYRFSILFNISLLRKNRSWRNDISLTKNH